MRHDEILGLLPRLDYGAENCPGLWLFGWELLFWLLVILLTIALVRFRPVTLQRAEHKLREISQYKRLWLVLFCLFVLVFRIALLPLVPVPVPVVHDEFSYLLASDTFSHGRLTNPASPMAVHFESFHINVLPTYQSMYPPAQGLALALGQKLTGVPWAGVLLSTALMCGAIYWMLLGWLPAPWAWLGGAAACARFGIFSYWINSYWGGSVAALGGALVLGALPRLRAFPTRRTALVFAAGLLILANSRPLEGLLFSAPIMVAVGLTVVRKGTENWRTRSKELAPAVMLLIIGFAWMLFYNWRGTGDPLLMPYVVNFRTYHISKPFLFQTPNAIPEYHHQVMRTFYVFHEFLDVLRAKDDPSYYVRMEANVNYAFFFWPFLLLVAPGLYAMWSSKLRVVLFSLGLLAAGLLSQIWPPHAHYTAPATSAIFLLILYSLHHFRSSHSKYGVSGSQAVAIVFALWLMSPIAATLLHPHGLIINEYQGPTFLRSLALQIQRERIKSELAARSGTHLVIVHHAWHESPWQDWIYNDADIDHAHVIWARDMGYFKNKELLSYYADRQVWYVDRGNPIAQLQPYDRAIAPWKLTLENPAFENNSSRSAAALGQQLSSFANARAHANLPGIPDAHSR